MDFLTRDSLLTLSLILVWSVTLLWRKEWRLPALIIALVLEISKTWFAFPFIDQSTPASPVLLDLTRLTIGIIILGWFWKWVRKRPPILVFDGVIPFMVAIFISLALTASRQTALTEVVRYSILFLLAISVADLFSEEATTRQFTFTIALAGGILGILGLVEYLGGWHYWPGLEMAYYPRAQATFVDSNIYARFLALAFLWTLYWWEEERHWGALVLGLAEILGLAVSMSRGGWISLAVALAIWIIVKRNKVLLWLSGGLAVLGLGFGLVNTQIRERFLTLFSGGNALGEVRLGLLKGGWDMFVTHPVTGIGLGNFQAYFEQYYQSLLIPHWLDVSRSHTSALTIAAEMGIIGLTALAYFIYAVLRSVIRLMRLGDNLAFLILLSLVVIFVSSQAEGRFFEDPWLWIMVGWLAQRQDYAKRWLK